MKDGNSMEADVAPVIPFAPYYRYLNYNGCNRPGQIEQFGPETAN